MDSLAREQPWKDAGHAVATNVIPVGMSELAVSRSREAILTVLGLGSCVAIAAYCRPLGIGAMLHAMLPRHRAGGGRTRFVDSGFEALLEALDREGARPAACDWWLTGGAQMLSVPGSQDLFQIGRQNVETATGLIRQHGLRLVGQDVNGRQGRTVRLYLADGSFSVRMPGAGERRLE